MPPTITIRIEPARPYKSKDNPHRDVICLGEILCTSDRPLAAAARILYNRGVPPETELVVHVGYLTQHHIVGQAAELDSKEMAKPYAQPYWPFLRKLGLAKPMTEPVEADSGA